MNAGRLVYRARQFWQALRIAPLPDDLEMAAPMLSPPQLSLFRSMPAGEQAHGLRVWRALQDGGECDTDLSTAALLHDAGKSQFPLSPWERVLIVVVETVCPACLRRWGSAAEKSPQEGYGWRKPFVVAVQHPAWGAGLAAAAGSSPEAAALIRRHQEKLPTPGNKPESKEFRRLRLLQAVDDNS
ncbi:MAG TPA: hypothetical protein VI776_00780 [Anaerolineales bacterium]|nr:hypothetical protein [Anaerolineales bacterium]